MLQKDSAQFAPLGLAIELASLQSETMDEWLLAEMYDTHLSNRTLQPSSKNTTLPLLQRILIVGGGPNGLYSLFRLFLDGHDVTLVEKRVRRDRAHFIVVDPIWAWQLRLLIVGSEFDRLFIDSNSSGSTLGLGGAGDSLFVRVNDLETLLKRRAIQFVTYVAQRNHQRRVSGGEFAVPMLHFELIYNAEFVGVEAPSQLGVFPHRLEAVLRVSLASASSPQTRQSCIEINGLWFAHSLREQILVDVVICGSGKSDRECKQRYLGEIGRRKSAVDILFDFIFRSQHGEKASHGEKALWERQFAEREPPALPQCPL